MKTILRSSIPASIFLITLDSNTVSLVFGHTFSSNNEICETEITG